MNPHLREFWSKPSRGKVLHGGRMSSKSWDAAANLVRIVQTVNVRVLCTRMFQNKIDESVYSLIKSQVERFGLTHKFEFQKSKIKCLTTGSEIFFYGLARNIDEIKSLENISLMWMEEAHALTEEMWTVIEPTITRNEGAEIWVIFNPKFATDFAYKRFVTNPPRGYIVRQINYDENEFLGPDALSTIAGSKEEDYDHYMHVYRGVPLNDDERVIIKRTWLDACINAHVKLGITNTGSSRIGFDVADDGPDYNATAYAYGCLLVSLEKWKGGTDEMFDSAARTYNLALKRKATVFYDAIGVGSGVGSDMKVLNELNATSAKWIAWNASGAIINPDQEYKDGILNKDKFVSAKAQAWWDVSDRIKETYMAVVHGKDFDPERIISISPECEHLELLFTELSTPHKVLSATGKSQLETKAMLDKRGIPSHNCADAFIMAYAPQEHELSFDWGAV